MAGGGGGGKSQREKEKTKMRERQRRGITTKIFHGLRKHGGYPLSPRADINEVLRHLALEAGWIVHPDGTTYRSISNFVKCCPVCGTATASATRTLVIGGDGGGGGECSTSASPKDHSVSATSFRGLIPSLHASSSHRNPNATAGNNSDAATAVIQLSHSTYGGCGSLLGNQSTVSVAPLSVAHQQHHLQEARASNPNTPVASPMRRA